MLSSWQVTSALPENFIHCTEEEIHELLTSCIDVIPHDNIPHQVKLVSVLLTNDEEIHQLNRQYRGKDKPTDVLSFSQLEDSSDDTTSLVGESLGDIVISIDTAERQAEEYGVTLREELSRLLVHGLLHLLGYEHEDVPEEQAQAMFTLQDSLLNRFQL